MENHRRRGCDVKKRLCILALSFAVLAAPTGAFASQEVRVKVNGDLVSFDVKPFLQEARTLIPVRGFFEKLGAQVRFDENENTAWVEDDYVTIQLVLDKNTAYIHRKYDFSAIPQEVKLDTAPRLINGRTFIPLRFLAESLGAKVGWDEDTCTVMVDMDSRITPVERPVSYRMLLPQEINSDSQLTAWVEKNYKTRGIHYTTKGDTVYVLASLGEKPTGGYQTVIDAVTMVSPGNIHVTAREISPAPGAMVTQALSYPYILITFEASGVKSVDGDILQGQGQGNLPFQYVTIESIQEKEELAKWYEANKNNQGIHYKRDGSDVYVLLAAGEKPTGGYTVNVQKVKARTPDEAFVYATVDRIGEGMGTIQAITYPTTLVKIQSDVLKHVGGEIIDNTVGKKTIEGIGAAIRAQDVKSIELLSLQNKKFRDYGREDFERLAGAFNKGEVSDSPYILSLAGSIMQITLTDGSKVNLSSYGSRTNIVASLQYEGKSETYHLICPEIALILMGKQL